MCHLKSSFKHSLTIKIGKVIVYLCEENINSKCFSWNLKETQTFKAYKTESYKYCIIPVKKEQKCFLIVNYLVRRKKIELLRKRETTAIGKSFMENQVKSRKYFSAHQ